MLRYMTAGESHGRSLIGILEGMPAGVTLDSTRINKALQSRQAGYGRGGRMSIESDAIDILSGVRSSETIGSPIAFLIPNRDNRIDELPKVHSPRPGHADLAGSLKYARRDMRDILERSSARETAARVAAGALCMELLRHFDIALFSHVVSIGGIDAHTAGLSYEDVRNAAEASQLQCADEAAEKLMKEEIDNTAQEGDTLGGVFEVVGLGIPAGLGSHVQWDRKLDGRLARALMSIQAVKGVEIGTGFAAAKRRGSRVHDELCYESGKARRNTNNAGGIEGGMSNGEPLIMRGVMKPIATLKKPLKSFDIITKKATEAAVERSDVCAVPSCAVVAAYVAAYEIAAAFLEKFGGDSLQETERNYRAYVKYLQKW